MTTVIGAGRPVAVAAVAIVMPLITVIGAGIRVAVTVTGATVVTAAVVTVGIRAVISIRVAPAPTPEREATKAADEGDIIKLTMVMMMPIAATPILATTPREMVISAWRGRDYRRGQRHRNKATQEKYRFCIHRLFQLRLPSLFSQYFVSKASYFLVMGAVRVKDVRFRVA
jgi:hypothetical protein